VVLNLKLNTMFNERIVVTVTPFSGTTTKDKNGNDSVMLQCIAGRMPNRNVLSGTVADRAGLKVDRTYLVQCREIGYDKEFGKQFNFIKIKELTTGKDITETCSMLGDPEIVNIPRPEGFDNAYTRKGDAVEGQITKRIQEGKFIPAYPRTATNHSTADDIVDGVSAHNDNEKRLDSRKISKKDNNPDLDRS
jgi:hypothetical protein